MGDKNRLQWRKYREIYMEYQNNLQWCSQSEFLSIMHIHSCRYTVILNK